MASQIAQAYLATFAKFVGKSFTSREIKAIMTTQNPGINTASLNVSDYCGVRDAEGKVTRKPGQATQYAPILFVANGQGGFTVLDPKEQVAKPASARSARGLTDAQVLEQVKARGIKL